MKGIIKDTIKGTAQLKSVYCFYVNADHMLGPICLLQLPIDHSEFVPGFKAFSVTKET